MSNGKNQLSIYDIASGLWGLVCVSLLPLMVHSTFHGLFLVRQEGETLKSTWDEPLNGLISLRLLAC